MCRHLKGHIDYLEMILLRKIFISNRIPVVAIILLKHFAGHSSDFIRLKEARGEFHRKSFFFKICSYTYNDIVYAYMKFGTDCMSVSRVMKL